MRNRSPLFGMMAASTALASMAAVQRARPETPEEETGRRARMVAAERARREEWAATASPSRPSRTPHALDDERLQAASRKAAEKARKRAAAWNGARS